jgi:RNA polymerase sigma-70 factor (ECF subfamily)
LGVTVEDLYRRLSPDVLRFALRLSGDEALAEDLVADAFVVALEGPARREIGSARALLFGAVRNLHLHARRDRARRPQAAAGEAGWLPSRGAGPEQSASARSELRQALEDLQLLPEEARAAVLLRAEGLDYEEIAATLGTTPGAAKVRVHRARVSLAARQVARETEGERP